MKVKITVPKGCRVEVRHEEEKPTGFFDGLANTMMAVITDVTDSPVKNKYKKHRPKRLF